MGCEASVPAVCVMCSGAVSNPKDGALGSVVVAVPSFDHQQGTTRIVTLRHASHGILIKQKRIPWRVEIPTDLTPGQKLKIVLVQKGHNRVAQVQQFSPSTDVDGCNDPDCVHHHPMDSNFLGSLQ